jgi:hypothetical protein
MVATLHNNSHLVRTWKHADNKSVYNRKKLVYKWLNLFQLSAMSRKLLKIVDGTANHIFVYALSFGTNFIVENYKI